MERVLLACPVYGGVQEGAGTGNEAERMTIGNEHDKWK